MPSIVYLVGPPASGKRTIGEALASLTGAALIDNHLINDPVFRAYGVDGRSEVPAWLWHLADQIREATMEAARRAVPGRSHIFTNYLSNHESELQVITALRNLAHHRDACFVPVWLTCREDELVRRVSLPDRAVRHKLGDPAALQDLLRTKGVLAPPPHALVLDTSTMDPETAAQRIRERADLP